MNIYTYYENIGFKNQTKLIDFWKTSWSNQGYNPIILTKSDVENHCFYNKFCNKINNIHKQIMDKDISDYGMSCFVRWLAYANLNEQQKFYVSDYDVINKNYPIIHPIEKLHFMDGHCPCIASGNSNQFMALCKMFINVSQSNMFFIRSNIKEPHYHDQEFLQYNYPPLSNICIKEFIMTRCRPTIGCFNLYDKNHSDSKIFHVAHLNVVELKEKCPDKINKYKSNHEIRLDAVEYLL